MTDIQAEYIGITGLRGAGKSTMAEKLRDLLQTDDMLVWIVPLAYNLKLMANSIISASSLQCIDVFDDRAKQVVISVPRQPARETFWSVARAFCEDPSEALVNHLKDFHERIPEYNGGERVMTFGRYLQLLGTQCLRGFDEDIHVKALAADIDREMPHFTGKKLVIVVPDIRNENEAAFVRGRGGRCVRVVAPSRVEPNDGRSATHESERGVPSITDEIENDFTDAFGAAVKAWYEAGKK